MNSSRDLSTHFTQTAIIKLISLCALRDIKLARSSNKPNTAARVLLNSMRRTVALALVRVVLAVDLSVAAKRDVHALLAVALELVVRAHGAVVLIAFVFALDVPVAAPGLRDAVHLSGGAWELLWGTCGRLWKATWTSVSSLKVPFESGLHPVISADEFQIYLLNA